MDWKSHLFFGALLGISVAYFALGENLQGAILFAAVSGASALLPDLDERKSKASQFLGMLAVAAVLIFSLWLSIGSGKGLQEFMAYALLLFLFLFVLDRLLRPRHRGITHGLLFLLAASAAAYFIAGVFFAAAFFTGYFSHLLSDRCIKVL